MHWILRSLLTNRIAPVGNFKKSIDHDRASRSCRVVHCIYTYMHNGWTTIKARKIGLKSCWARNSMPMHKKEPIEFKNITQKWDNCYCARAANKMTACPNAEYKEILAWNSMWSCNENAQQIAIKRTKIVNKKTGKIKKNKELYRAAVILPPVHTMHTNTTKARMHCATWISNENRFRHSACATESTSRKIKTKKKRTTNNKRSDQFAMIGTNISTKLPQLMAGGTRRAYWNRH